MGLPDGSNFHSHRGDKLSPLRPTSAEAWIATEYGQRVPFMREQVLPLGKGFAVLMLWMDAEDDEYDPEEGMTAKERFANRAERYRRS